MTRRHLSKIAYISLRKKNGAATLKVLMAQQVAMGGLKLKVIVSTNFSTVAPKMALNTK